jgi:hypothetical protein
VISIASRPYCCASAWEYARPLLRPFRLAKADELWKLLAYRAIRASSGDSTRTSACSAPCHRSGTGSLPSQRTVIEPPPTDWILFSLRGVVKCARPKKFVGPLTTGGGMFRSGNKPRLCNDTGSAAKAKALQRREERRTQCSRGLNSLS